MYEMYKVLIFIYEQSENKLIAIYLANLLQVAQATLANVDVALAAAGVDNVGTKGHGVDKAGCVTDSSNQVKSFLLERSMYSIPPASIARKIYTTLCNMRWYVPVTVAIVVTILLLMMIYIYIKQGRVISINYSLGLVTYQKAQTILKLMLRDV
jgi:hypothetical protein